MGAALGDAVYGTIAAFGLTFVSEFIHRHELWIRAVALSTDGTLSIRRSASGDPADAVGVGSRLATDMLAEGAGRLDDPTAPQTVPGPTDVSAHVHEDKVHNA